MNLDAQTAYENYVATKNPADEVLPFNLWLPTYEEQLQEAINDVRRRLPYNHIDMILYLTEKCMEIQNSGKATSFVNISGHVQKFEIAIYAPFWVPNADPSFKVDFYTDRPIEELNKHKEALLNYLQTL